MYYIYEYFKLTLTMKYNIISCSIFISNILRLECR